MSQTLSEHDLIRRLETAAADAMPALYTRFYDGSLLRFAGGYTRRANSIQPLYSSSLSPDEKIQYCEALYEWYHLPVIYKLTAACQPPDLEARLIDRGYEPGQSVHVQTCPLDSLAETPPISGSPRLTEAWFSAYVRMNGVPEAHQGTLRDMLRKIVRPTWYALVKDDQNQPIAAALAVLDNDLIGIFDVVVDSDHRQQGLGTTLMHGLLAYGKQHGARQAYLQVSAENTAGLRLYHRLGFRDAYRYWYRQKG